MKKKILKEFLKYAGFSMLSALGMSCYILADTLFIANGVGSIGLTALNLVLPIYNVIFGLGLLIGIGGATRFSILKSQEKDKDASQYFSISILIGLVISIPFIIAGLFFSKETVQLLGGNHEVVEIASVYFKTIVLFTPFFILSQMITVFVRNDHNPRLASIAMLMGTLFNIVFDYILIFPCGLGMFGAALATAISPIVSIGVCCIHLFSKDSSLKYKKHAFELRKAVKLIKVGIPAFITELSAGVVIFAFNMVILSMSGNIGVASYGIISNLTIVIVSLFTGISQAIQPLVSRSYGRHEHQNIQSYVKYSLILCLIISSSIYLIVRLAPETIVSLFNSENDLTMSTIAINGMFIYFIGFFFVGLNMVYVSYFASTERIKSSFAISILRSGFIIIPILLILSQPLGLDGVWLSYPISEVIILLIAFILQKKHKQIQT